MSVSLPPNVLLLATHGTYAWPEQSVAGGFEFSEAYQNELLRKNFSDFATGELLKLFDQRQVIAPPQYGRAFVDPNRALECIVEGVDYRTTDDDGIDKTIDFNGVEVFAREPSTELRRELIETVYSPYFKQIETRVFRMLDEQESGIVLVVDIHDTGNFLMNADGSTIRRHMKHRSGESIDGFVGAVVSDLDGATAPDGFSERFATTLRNTYEQHGINIDSQGGVHVNTPFSGAQVIDFGRLCKLRLHRENRGEDAHRLVFVQLELNRSRLLDESTQSLRTGGIEAEARIIQETLTAVI